MLLYVGVFVKTQMEGEDVVPLITIYRGDNWKKMMSGLVGFIAFPEGYTCSIFSAYKDKVPKSTSTLGVQDPEWDEGKHSIVMLIISSDFIMT